MKKLITLLTIPFSSAPRVVFKQLDIFWIDSFQADTGSLRQVLGDITLAMANSEGLFGYLLTSRWAFPVSIILALKIFMFNV